MAKGLRIGSALELERPFIHTHQGNGKEGGSEKIGEAGRGGGVLQDVGGRNAPESLR